MNVNPVSPVHWSGSDQNGQLTKQKFATDETTKAAETARPVDAAEDVTAVTAKTEDKPRAAPPSVLQLKIQEILNTQADTIDTEQPEDDSAQG